MKLVLQRVAEASVTVGESVVGSIGAGLLVLCGIGDDDGEADAEWACRKLLNIRLWGPEEKPWSQSVAAAKLDVLLVSQFTLHAVLKGNKPDFHHAMGPARSRPFWDDFVARVRREAKGLQVQTGTFGASMAVRLLNDGPVTIELESPARAPAPAAAPAASAAGGAPSPEALLVLRLPRGSCCAALRELERRGLRLVAWKSTAEAQVAAALRAPPRSACSSEDLAGLARRCCPAGSLLAVASSAAGVFAASEVMA